MPQFSEHLPVTEKAMKDARYEYRRAKTLPIGLIGENNKFAYGYDGNKYYVTEGVLYHLITKICLTLSEAKQLYNALSFNCEFEACSSTVSKAIKASRKKQLSEDGLFWFLVEEIK